jgi:hypothetical protein
MTAVTPEALKAYLDALDEKGDRILAQTIITNGRVTQLELQQATNTAVRAVEQRHTERIAEREEEARKETAEAKREAHRLIVQSVSTTAAIVGVAVALITHFFS